MKIRTSIGTITMARIELTLALLITLAGLLLSVYGAHLILSAIGGIPAI